MRSLAPYSRLTSSPSSSRKGRRLRPGSMLDVERFSAELPGLAAGRQILFDELARLAKPETELTVSEHADRYRVVSPESGSPFPGPWSTNRVPYLREPQDCLHPDHPSRRVTLKFSAQTGKSELGVNWFAYVVDRAPGPMLTVLPTGNEAIKYNRVKIQPTIDASPRIRHRVRPENSRDEGASTTAFKRFAGGFNQITTASSSKGLQMVSIRWLVLDEVIPKAPLVDSRGGFPNRGRADSSWRGRFAPCHQRSDCERTIRLRRFGRSPGVRRTLTRAGGFCRWLRSWTAWTGARRRRSAGWIARRCVTGSIASTGRVWRASSTTGRRVPSLVFRRSNWLSSRRSSRRVRIVRRTGSCAGVGSTSNASSPRGSVSTFIRAMSESSSRNWASPTSVRGPVIQLKTSGPSRLSKKLPARAEGPSRGTARDDAGRNLV